MPRRAPGILLSSKGSHRVDQAPGSEDPTLKAGKTARGGASGIRSARRRALSRVEISVCPALATRINLAPTFPPIPIISGLFSLRPETSRPMTETRTPGADSRPHGGDPPARQAALLDIGGLPMIVHVMLRRAEAAQIEPRWRSPPTRPKSRPR